MGGGGGGGGGGALVCQESPAARRGMHMLGSETACYCGYTQEIDRHPADRVPGSPTSTQRNGNQSRHVHACTKPNARDGC